MKKIIYSLGSVLAFVGIVVFVLYYFEVIDFRSFPEAHGAKEITLECNYNGEDIELDYTLYQSINSFYGGEPKKDNYQYRREFGEYVFTYPEDNTLSKLVDKIEARGDELGFSRDQTADLAICFVQNIPYDQKKADLILSSSFQGWDDIKEKEETLSRFPYETLFDNKGICTDKSYLASYFLKEMGYGSSILTFDRERHMAIGVDVPEGYGSFNTNYSYIETTSPGYKVGQLPVMDEGGGRAKERKIEKINPKNITSVFSAPKISAPNKISKVNENEGDEYRRIIEIAKINERIKELSLKISKLNAQLLNAKEESEEEEAVISEMGKIVKEKESNVGQAEDVYKSNPTNSNYNQYLRIYRDYKDYYSKYEGELAKYNSMVREYNGEIKTLNSYIDEYNVLVKKD